MQRHVWVDFDFQPWKDHQQPNPSKHSEQDKPHIPPIVEITHSYDAASNRLDRYNTTATLAWTHRDDEFDYDGLHRLKEAARGVRDGSFTHATGDQKSRQWDLDSLGNWNDADAQTRADDQTMQYVWGST